ncbi:MAG: homocitrate synthase [Candidatus Altiarchaeales archaeon]|nr:homocitrate synthase [Candidatus Altiarchaeales archaeon]MBD3417296.1 homocitrate synthase [Candidatus Altiarchaeales archaeon]
MNRIYIIDVTNRDGVQTSRIGLAKLEKTMINRYLDKMGVWQSEFGFPATRHETNYLNANLELRRMGAFKRIRLSGWARAITSDVEKAFNYVPKTRFLNLSISTSRQMIQGKFRGKIKWRDILDSVGKSLDRAYELGAKDVGVNAEDASRTKMQSLIRFAENAKEHGATRIRYCDTLGYDDPFTIYDRISELALSTGMDVEVHCHNDLGMANACSIAGAKAAVDSGVNAYINTTVNGIGERAGNADLVSILLAVEKSSGFAGKYRLAGRIDLKKSWKISNYAARGFGIPLQFNQVAVGNNAFAHESGIHVDGALKDHRNYELYHHEEVGRGHIEEIDTGRQITTGEYSGIKGFKSMAGNYKIKFENDEEARTLLELIRYANVHTQKPVTEDEVKFIAKYPDQARKIMTVSP